jgi:hypothetical protein
LLEALGERGSGVGRELVVRRAHAAAP